MRYLSIGQDRLQVFCEPRIQGIAPLGDGSGAGVAPNEVAEVCASARLTAYTNWWTERLSGKRTRFRDYIDVDQRRVESSPQHYEG